MIYPAWGQKLCHLRHHPGGIRSRTDSTIHLHTGPIKLSEATYSLGILQQLPGHRFWPMEIGYIDATYKFEGHLFGHQQVTDSYLLGLAIVHKGRLATTERKIQHLAGVEYANNLELI